MLIAFPVLDLWSFGFWAKRSKMALTPIFEMLSICIVIIHEIEAFFVEITKKIFLELFHHLRPNIGTRKKSQRAQKRLK